MYMKIVNNNHAIKHKNWYMYMKIIFKFLKQSSVHSIRKMTSHYKNKELLKIQPFYSSEIESNKKKRKSRLEIYLDYHHLLKN